LRSFLKLISIRVNYFVLERQEAEAQYTQTDSCTRPADAALAAAASDANVAAPAEVLMPPLSKCEAAEDVEINA
jgi:hypothetical protein